MDAEQSLISRLIPSLKNKLATAVLEAGKQFHHVPGNSLTTDSLIEVLSLQAITRSKIRLTTNNHESLKNDEFS